MDEQQTNNDQDHSQDYSQDTPHAMPPVGVDEAASPPADETPRDVVAVPDVAVPADVDDMEAADDNESADEAFREPAALVEAILFTTDSPLPAARIAQIAQLQGTKIVRQAAKDLNEKYERMGCSFRVEEIGGGYQMMTLPEYHDVLGRLSKTRADTKLSQAGLEALAIIAYRQPILRADVEAIRGVASGEILRTLMEKQLVKIVGRAEVIGRPMLYGTTRRFLDVFGLASLEDLPRVEELKTPRDTSKPTPTPTPDEPAASEASPMSPAAVEPAVATAEQVVELAVADPGFENELSTPPAGEYQSDSSVS